jgi:hypothetical protein
MTLTVINGVVYEAVLKMVAVRGDLKTNNSPQKPSHNMLE